VRDGESFLCLHVLCGFCCFLVWFFSFFSLFLGTVQRTSSGSTQDSTLHHPKTFVPEPKTLNSGEYTPVQLERLLDSRDSAGYKSMLPNRERLPAYKMREEILSVVRKSSVVVVAGATGCGKTTQVHYQFNSLVPFPHTVNLGCFFSTTMTSYQRINSQTPRSAKPQYLSPES
jgi:hypothetical protein